MREKGKTFRVRLKKSLLFASFFVGTLGKCCPLHSITDVITVGWFLRFLIFWESGSRLDAGAKPGGLFAIFRSPRFSAIRWLSPVSIVHVSVCLCIRPYPTWSLVWCSHLPDPTWGLAWCCHLTFRLGRKEVAESEIPSEFGSCAVIWASLESMVASSQVLTGSGQVLSSDLLPPLGGKTASGHTPGGISPDAPSWVGGQMMIAPGLISGDALILPHTHTHTHTRSTIIASSHAL